MIKEKTLSTFYGIGQRIKKRREKLGLNQRELANKLGVSFRTIQNYESNLVNPKIEVLDQLTEIFDCDLEYLIYGKTKNELIGEEFMYFDSMYKNLEELEEVNYLISNFNHELDNIENSKVRKKLIKEFTRLIKENIDWMKNRLNAQSFKEKNFGKIHEINKVREKITQYEILINETEDRLSIYRMRMNNLFKEYQELLSNINKEN